MGWDTLTWLQFILVLVNIAVALALLWYASETRKLRKETSCLVDENKESRKALVRPCIECSVEIRYHETRGTLREVWLHNAGLGIAEDIRDVRLTRRLSGAPRSQEETVVPSQDPDTRKMWPDNYRWLHPCRETTLWTLYQGNDDYVWKVYAEKEDSKVYNCKLVGSCQDMLGNRVPFELLFDTENRKLTPNEY